MKLICAFILLTCALVPAWAQSQYVFLVTGDGIRHQELFTGADAALTQADTNQFSGIEDIEKFKQRFWAETPAARREKLMPFMWNTIAKSGTIFGNRSLGSKVVVKNPHHFSYPGYAEILNGQPLAAIASNDPVWSPQETILEYVRRELKLSRNEVVAFGSWKIFNWITMQRDNSIFCNAGYEAMPQEFLNDRTRFWNDLQFETLSPWDSVRHDSVTFNLALEFIKNEKPKFVYLALGETDDWAHDRRYDRTLETLQYFDNCLSNLWTQLQSDRMYKGKSTLIVTTDHGRGRTLEDWTSHNAKTPGADETWIAMIGPKIPALGEVSGGPEYSASNIAATILQLFGLDVTEYSGSAAPAIKDGLKPFSQNE